jgi:hypothetical protein
MDYITDHPELLIAIAAAWPIALLIVRKYVCDWKCPRCGQPFLRDTIGYCQEFARRCVHCNLARWADEWPSPPISNSR